MARATVKAPLISKEGAPPAAVVPSPSTTALTALPKAPALPLGAAAPTAKEPALMVVTPV